MRTYVRGIQREPNDFITVMVAEELTEGFFGYLLRRRDLIRLKGRMLREPGVVVTDVPVAVEKGEPVRAEGKPLIPHRTVTLVFVSNANDVAVRAVNYAQSLEASETRAIYFDMDPEEAHSLEEQWFDKRLGIPLDIVEAPFRDLSIPMLAEVRSFTSRGDTLVNVVVPELIVTKRRHLLLHNQNALFIKRLFLYEPRALLTSVPLVLADELAAAPA